MRAVSSVASLRPLVLLRLLVRPRDLLADQRVQCPQPSTVPSRQGSVEVVLHFRQERSVRVILRHGQSCVRRWLDWPMRAVRV